MAYGLKYFSRYRNYDGVVKRVKLYKIDFTGDAIEWLNDELSVTFSYGDSDSFFPDIPIIASQAKIGFIFQEQYDLSEFVFDRKTFFCEIFNETNSRIEWSGWVEPWNAQHAYSKPPYTASLTVSCGLAHLAKIKYVNPNTTFKKTGLQLIQECLAIMGSELNLRVSTHMKENSFAGSGFLGLTSFEINTVRYYDQNGEAMHCDEIINDILNKVNGEILQWDNRWVVRAVVDHSTGLETDFIEYPFGGGSTVSLPWPTTYIVNDSNALSLDGGVVRILPPITKYRTEVDFGSQLPYFENGNMLIWTEDGLVGWDFSHMAKGNPGWERYYIGTENSLSVLKINGKAPQPYQKRKKKTFWQKATNVAINIAIAGTGAAGALFNKAVLKGKYYDIEPTEWIESSVGNISKGDKTLTISFDYETAAFSGEVLVSVMLPMEYEPYNTLWLDPGSPNSGTSDEFVLIRVPAINRDNLISRGFINVAGNPNYPSGTTINWTYVVEGVPLGETRKIGGASGVLVENGDLIISKIANAGGTQAAVGASWEIINIRNNVKRGTFEREIWLDKINFLSPKDIDKPIPYQEVYVRFYKLSDEEGKIGDWYKVYNLRGALEGFVASDESSRYATTLERGSKTDEEAETIQLITGDYNPWFSGSLTKPGSQENTSSWRRRTALNEGFSVYRAMMLDRLSMTSRPLKVVQADITLRSGTSPVTYLHTLVMNDIDDMRMRIVRFEFQDTTRIVSVTAVEVKYEEIPADQLRQDSYIPGSRTLNVIPGQGDGVYPTKQDSTNGRISAEDVEFTDEELLDVIRAGARIISPFDELPALTYTKGVQSSDFIDMSQYLLEEFVLENEDQEDEDLFDLNTLVFTVTNKPSWIKSVTFDGLVITASGKPPLIGNFFLDIDLYEDESKLTIPFRVPVLSRPPLTIKYTLRDTSGVEPVAVGIITNGSGHLLPTTWDIQVQITGQHEGWYARVTGGGIDIQQTEDPYAIVNDTDYATYIIGSDIFSEPGIYNLNAAAFRIERMPDYMNLIKRDLIQFTLYDEEYVGKAKFYLWGAESDTLIGLINPNGSSAFTVEEAWDVKMVIEGVEHDEATSVLGSEVGDLDTVNFDQDPAVEDATYFQLGEPRPEFDPSNYNVLLSLYLEGDEKYKRSISFTINKDKVVVTSDGLKIGSQPVNTTNFELVAELATTGNAFVLIPNWVLLNDATSGEFDWEGVKLYEYKTGYLVEQNISTFTGRPQFRSYAEPITQSDYYAFGELNSTKIGDIHRSPSTFRVIYTRRLGGETGEDVAVYQSDFSFGEAVDITETPIKAPGALYSDYVAGDALGEEIVDEGKKFNVRVDGVTIIVDEPNNPLKNHLKVKGITTANLPDFPRRIVLGNITQIPGKLTAIDLIDNINDASDDNIAPALLIKNYITNIFESSIDGTVNRIPKFGTAHELVDSIIREITGRIGIGIDPTEALHVSGNVLSSGQLKSGVATGTAPLVVSSTTKVINLNADLLDDQTGAYYLDWNNFTNKPSDTNQYIFRGGFQGADADTLLSAGWYDNGGTTVTTTNIPVLKSGFIQVTPYKTSSFNAVTQDYITTGAVDANYGRKFFRVSWNGVYSAWKEYAFRDWVLGLGYSSGTVTSVGMSVPTGFSIGGTPVTTSGTLALGFAAGYSLPTTAKQTNWDTAFGWGNHAGLYVTSARTFSAGTGLVGGGSLAANRTISFDTTWGDDRYVVGTSPSMDWDTVNSNAKSKFNTNGTNGPLGGTVVHGAFFSHGGNSSYGTSLAFRNGRGFWRSIEAASWGGWTEFASQPWVSSNYAAIGVSITGANSITGGGSLSTNRTLSLVNDNATPGNNMLYGTNGSGTKGWYAQPSGGGGTITGSGTAGYFAKWSGTTALTNTVVQDTGTEINIANSRSFGVEGPAAMRNYLHVWGYASFGTASNHGSLVIHNTSSATAVASAALEIRSTTKGVLPPRMTRAQRLAISSPADGLEVFQNETVGASLYGKKTFMAGQWVHNTWDLGAA